MRVLFASTQGAGHFGPLVPFLEAAARDGHEALVVGPPTLDARGYAFRAGAAPPDEVLRHEECRRIMVRTAESGL